MSQEKKKEKSIQIKLVKDLINSSEPAMEILSSLEESPFEEVRELLSKYRQRELKEVKRLESMLIYEQRLWDKGIGLVAGIDEAGRGPLAGPVAAAAVILDASAVRYLHGLDDSKKLSTEKRYSIEVKIKEHALFWAVAWQNHREIDRDNILQATKSAMKRAVNRLDVVPEYLLLDATNLESMFIPQEAIIKGDQKSLSIAAASILAKCWRDRIMIHFDRVYPQYNFVKHKGYPTAEHREKLLIHGPSLLHRKSFVVKGGN